MAGPTRARLPRAAKDPEAMKKKQEEMAKTTMKGKKRTAEDEPSIGVTNKKQKQDAGATNKAAGKKRGREGDETVPAVAKKAKIDQNEAEKQKKRTVKAKTSAIATKSGLVKVESSITSSNNTAAPPKSDTVPSKTVPSTSNPEPITSNLGPPTPKPVSPTSKPGQSTGKQPAISQNSAIASQTSAATSKTGGPTSNLVSSTSKPVPSTSNPVPPTSKPVPATAKPGASPSKPGASSTKGTKRAPLYDEADAAPAKKRKAAPAKKPAGKKGKAEPAKKKRKAAPKKKKARLPNGLDIFVCGSGPRGELGLGPVPPASSKKASVQAVREPRLNRLLDNDGVGVLHLAAGGRHGVALTYDGRVVTWGAHEHGVLGRYTEPAANDKEQRARAKLDGPMAAAEVRPGCTPAVVESGAWPAGTRFKQVVATESATFAVAEASEDLQLSGAVYGWGTFKGETGAPFGFVKGSAAAGQRIHEQPIQIQQLRYVKKLAAGANHVVALSHTGQVFAWGCGGRGQLGRRLRGFRESRLAALVPQAVAFDQKIVDVASGRDHSFAVDADGAVWAWGANDFAQTGTATGDGAPVLAPTRVARLRPHKLAEIAGGAQHSLARTEDGRVLVWGRCEGGRLGVDAGAAPADHRREDGEGRPVTLEVPTEVSGIVARSIAAGNDYSFVVTMPGKVLGWGGSAGFKTGLKTEAAVARPTAVGGKDMGGVRVASAACRGSFSVFAAPVDIDDSASSSLSSVPSDDES